MGISKPRDCAYCRSQGNARNLSRDERWPGHWCGSCRQRYDRTGSVERPSCADCGAWIVPSRSSSPTHCTDCRPCAVCGTVGAKAASRDERWPGAWCDNCAALHGRHGDPTHRELDRTRTPEERFAELTGEPNQVTGCTPWIGSRNASGHGLFRLDGAMLGAHRVALAWHLGRELEEGEQALHLCDNPPCVNVEHLELGDHTRNMGDKVLAGTSGRAFTDAEVLLLREEHAAGASQTQLAERYGVSQSTVSHALNGTRAYARTVASYSRR